MLKTLRERANRLLQNTEVQRAISWASDTSRRMRENLEEMRRLVADSLSVEGHDDLEKLKRELDEMTERSERERSNSS